MKLPGKKAIILSIATLVIVPSMAFATISLVKPKADEKAVEPVQQVAIAEEKEAAVPVAEEVPAETTPVATTPVVEPVAAPVILSTQEYAEKYLDMAAPWAQECLNRIIVEWPHRFTPEVREQNIKALRSWRSVCSTGVMDPVVEARRRSAGITISASLIYQYGANGEWFETAQAAKYANAP